MRAAVGGDDPHGVVHLMHDRNVSLALENLDIVVVSAGKYRYRLLSQNQALCAQRPVFRSVELVPAVGGVQRLVSLSCLRNLRRNGALGPQDQRGAKLPRKLGLAAVEPELAEVVMHVFGSARLGRTTFFFVEGYARLFFLDRRL